jgi:hypothetical protein
MIVRYGALALIILGCLPPAHAQEKPKAPPPALSEYGVQMSRYYEKPFDVPAFLTSWQRLGGEGRDAMMAFLAGLFVKHPDQIRIVTARSYERHAEATVIQGLRLAGKTPEALRAAERWGWPPEQMKPITPVVPLARIKADSPQAFDLLWAASFASADEIYVRPIYAYFASVASEKGVDPADLAATALARHARNTDVGRTLSAKYPRDVFIRIVYAASALWSLESNARQHRFVAAAVDRFVKEQPDTVAAKTFTGYARQVRALGAPQRRG